VVDWCICVLVIGGEFDKMMLKGLCMDQIYLTGDGGQLPTLRKALRCWKGDHTLFHSSFLIPHSSFILRGVQ